MGHLWKLLGHKTNYFGNNKDDFCAIVEYIEEEHEARIDVTYMDFKDVHNLQNKDIFNLLYLAGYDRVCDYTKFDFETNEFEEDTMISFYLPNLILKDGEMQAIIYSEKELYNDVSGDWEIERKIVYEEIDENWYIAYRSE